MLIGLSGKAGSGKDTLADIFLNVRGHGVKLAFAGPLKQACGCLFGLSDRQLHDPILKEQEDSRWGRSPRKILQFVGTNLLREQFDKDIFIKTMRSRIEAERANTNMIIVTDCRFENESQLIRDMGGSILHIVRPGVITTQHNHHVSEQATERLSTDFVIVNDTDLENFEKRGINLLAKLSIKYSR